MHTEGIYAEIPIHKIKPGENFLAGNGFPYIKVATCTQTPAPGHWGVHLTTGDLSKTRLPLIQRRTTKMRDPERIERVLNSIREVWELQPDLRLLQLLFHILADLGPLVERNLFYLEDHSLEEYLKQWREKSPLPPPYDQKQPEGVLGTIHTLEAIEALEDIGLNTLILPFLEWFLIRL